MVKGSAQIFLQGKYTNGQTKHGKIPNTISHQGNTNQEQKEIPLHNIKRAIIEKLDNDKKKKDKSIEKLEPSYIASGDIKWWSHFGKQPGIPSKC